MTRTTTFVVAVLAAAFAAAAPAQDLRDAYRQAEQARREVDERAALVEQEILADRARLQAEVDRLEAAQAARERQLAELEDRLVAREALRVKLAETWAAGELDFKEISGNVRLAAREVETLVHQSPLTAFLPGRLEQVSPLLDTGYFPGIDDISGLVQVLLDEIRLSGQVAMHEASYTGRDGIATTGKVLTLGRFTAAYVGADETGFLRWSPEAGSFVALAKLPSGGIGRALDSYVAGRSPKAPLDLSGGSALAQVNHQTTIGEQLQAGGPLVWPILGLAVAALLIVVTRLFFLNRIHHNTDRFMGEVNELAAKGDWAAAEDYVQEHGRRKSPVIEVIKAGLSVRHKDRETQESVLQEAILHQLPRVESGLSVLAVLGAVAPLLGLLGTVTGMINTFRVITLFGTGDPKLMSGGISEALITTELGLAVAIPIMLLHTFLQRRADHIIGEMEEKAVALTNIIQTRGEIPQLRARAANAGSAS
ncbi:MAG: MotA/TolQ/ExbB proton channel family protein [Candidatus Krumholzibacteriia bacterium]